MFRLIGLIPILIALMQMDLLFRVIIRPSKIRFLKMADLIPNRSTRLPPNYQKHGLYLSSPTLCSFIRTLITTRMTHPPHSPQLPLHLHPLPYFHLSFMSLWAIPLIWTFHPYRFSPSLLHTKSFIHHFSNEVSANQSCIQVLICSLIAKLDFFRIFYFQTK